MNVVIGRLACWFTFAVLITYNGAAVAQDKPAGYPIRPIRFIVAVAPGAGADAIARAAAQMLTDRWGQQVVVDNRPGGGGVIATELVAKAPPDGYTYLVADLGSTTITVLTHDKTTLDLQRDFAPVTIISYSPHLFCVHPSVPAATIKQFIALAKARPGKFNFATAGQTTAPHFSGMLFVQRTGVTWEYIPGKGGVQAILDVASGQADVLFNGMLATLPYVKSGKLKLLAVSSEKRNTSLPDTPTVMESGVRDFVTGSWQGILAPGKTPPEILARMQTETRRILFTPDVREKLSGQGAEPMGSSPAETAEFMRRERERWSQLIRDTHYKL